jgi:lactoylglutathione lyase
MRAICQPLNRLSARPQAGGCTVNNGTKTEAATKANVQQAVPFFRVSNIAESIRYYVDGLGFQMTNKWLDEGKLRWCWLQLGGAALMLQEIREEGRNSWSPAGKVGEGVSICFQCQDALEIYRDVTERGIQTSEPFVGNNMWVVGLKDPDGYRIEFESATDVPEETKFSEWQSAHDR